MFWRIPHRLPPPTYTGALALKKVTRFSPRTETKDAPFKKRHSKLVLKVSLLKARSR